MCSIKHYVIKFVCDLKEVGGFLLVSSTNKADCYDIAIIEVVTAAMF
jgi:hypothetical protein